MDLRNSAQLVTIVEMAHLLHAQLVNINRCPVKQATHHVKIVLSGIIVMSQV